MASQTKRSRPRRIRYRIEAECESEAGKDALGRRFERVRQLLNPGRSRVIDNETLLNTMFDVIEQAVEPTSCHQSDEQELHVPTTHSFMKNSGK